MKLQNNLDHRPGTRSAIFRKYFFPVSLIMLCAFSLLAGCQLQNILTPEDQRTLESTATSSPMDTLTPATTPTAETAAPATSLVIWLPPHLDPENGTPAGEILKERLASFQLDHPQYTVVIRIKALEGESGINGALESASTIAPASLPSIIALPYSIMESAAVDGLLAPISSDTLIINDPDWLPYAREVARVNDTAYGTPFGGDALVLAYRPLVVPDPPKTWQGVINQEQFVSFPADESSAAVVTQMYLSAGGSLQNSDGSPVLESDPLESALEILYEGAQRDVFPTWITGYTSFDESWQTFVNQQAYYSVIWSSQYLLKPPENVSVTDVPVLGDKPITVVQGWLWCIPAYSTTNEQDSLLLLEYLSDPAFVNRWSRAAGYLPVRESGLESWRDHPNSQFIGELIRRNQMILFSAPNEISTPMLREATVQIISKQAYYRQLLDDIMSHFQVK
jgi:ABC-type glycerol-3-phosphate transport system substrate-binding protein